MCIKNWIRAIVMGLVLFIIILTFVRKAYIWLPDYLVFLCNERIVYHDGKLPKHIVFVFVDHFEPYFATRSDEVAMSRVNTWVNGYPKIANKHKDSDGKRPQYTWFIPEDMLSKDYDFLHDIVGLEKYGYGEIEMHLHHKDDTSELFRAKIRHFKDAVGKEEGSITRNRFAYIAGNWALDNSRFENGKNFSGVNNELEVLREEGCFADFTFPAISQSAQPAKINSIYYAKDDPLKPNSYNWGVDVQVGKGASGDLMIVEGPLAIEWYDFMKRMRPSFEDGNICDTFVPTTSRVDKWIKSGIHIKGKPEWVFVKIFAHGCEDKTIPVILGKPVDEMFTYLEKKYNDGTRYVLHYVTARECYNIIKAAELGMQGNPGQYRDFVVPPYIKNEKSN